MHEVKEEESEKNISGYPGYRAVDPPEMRHIRNCSPEQLRKRVKGRPFNSFLCFVTAKHSKGFFQWGSKNVPVRIIGVHRRKPWQKLAQGVVDGETHVFEVTESALRPKRRRAIATSYTQGQEHQAA